MQRTPGKVESGARHGLVGDNEFARKVLGQGFESARGVDGVADRGDRGGIAIAHLSDNGGPAMNADTDAQRPVEFGPQGSVQLVETHGNEPGGGERLAAAGMGAALDPEQCHDAVSYELVDASSRRFDRSSHRCEITVENEHHVIGKPAFGERGEAANVDEQDRNLALAALRKVDSAPPVRGMRKRRQQRRHLDRAARPQLAGEANIGCADAVKYAHLVLSRGIDTVDLAAHPNAASRAATTAAAYRGMRNASEAARLEHDRSGCDLDNPTVMIADAHDAM